MNRTWILSVGAVLLLLGPTAIATPQDEKASLTDVAFSEILEENVVQGTSEPAILTAASNPSGPGILSGTCNFDGGSSSNMDYRHPHSLTWTWAHHTWSPAVQIDNNLYHCRTPVDSMNGRFTVILYTVQQTVKDPAMSCNVWATGDRMSWEWDGQGTPDEAEWNTKLWIRPVTGSGHQLMEASPNTFVYHSSGTINLEISLAYRGVGASVSWPFSWGGTAWYVGEQSNSQRVWTGSKGQCSQTDVYRFEFAQYHTSGSNPTFEYNWRVRPVHWTGVNSGHWHEIFPGPTDGWKTWSHCDC